MGPVWGVVVAGGSGSRFGQRKQFLSLGDRPVAAWSVTACRSVCDGVVVVVPEGADIPELGADRVVTGGASRSAAVRCGLAAVPAGASVVVVHDAARPLARPGLFRAVLQALEDPDVAGAICAVPVADTLKEVDDARVVRATVPRDGLVAVQTPQAFRREVLEQAHAGAGDATDDAGLVEHLGATVVVVEGDHDNIKITTPADLSYAAHLFGA